MEGNYTIVLFREGGEGAGVERVLVRHENLQTVALASNHHDDYPRNRGPLRLQLAPGF
jgi:hypothetical protein